MPDDFSELMQLGADIAAAPEALPKYLRKALDVTSVKIKKGSQATVRGRKGFSHAANAIDFELSGSSGKVSEMSSEIGYNEDKPAGKLGRLVELGAPNAKKHMLVRDKSGKLKSVPVPGDIAQPLAPSHDLGNALLNNEDDFQKGVAAAVDDAMKDVGL